MVSSLQHLHLPLVRPRMVSVVGALVPYALSAATRNWYWVSGLSPVSSAQVLGVVNALTQGPETPSRFSTT